MQAIAALIPDAGPEPIKRWIIPPIKLATRKMTAYCQFPISAQTALPIGHKKTRLKRSSQKLRCSQLYPNIAENFHPSSINRCITHLFSLSFLTTLSNATSLTSSALRATLERRLSLTEVSVRRQVTVSTKNTRTNKR